MASSRRMTTRLLLIRHGATALTAEDRFSGSVGVDLSDEGRAQARRLGERLAAAPIAAVYASPLSRTLETATIVAEPHTLVPIARDGLREISHGRWRGSPGTRWNRAIRTSTRPGSRTLSPSPRRVASRVWRCWPARSPSSARSSSRTSGRTSWWCPTKRPCACCSPACSASTPAGIAIASISRRLPQRARFQRSGPRAPHAVQRHFALSGATPPFRRQPLEVVGSGPLTAVPQGKARTLPSPYWAMRSSMYLRANSRRATTASISEEVRIS